MLNEEHENALEMSRLDSVRAATDAAVWRRPRASTNSQLYAQEHIANGDAEAQLPFTDPTSKEQYSNQRNLYSTSQERLHHLRRTQDRGTEHLRSFRNKCGIRDGYRSSSSEHGRTLEIFMANTGTTSEHDPKPQPSPQTLLADEEAAFEAAFKKLHADNFALKAGCRLQQPATVSGLHRCRMRMTSMLRLVPSLCGRRPNLRRRTRRKIRFNEVNSSKKRATRRTPLQPSLPVAKSRLHKLLTTTQGVNTCSRTRHPSQRFQRLLQMCSRYHRCQGRLDALFFAKIRSLMNTSSVTSNVYQFPAARGLERIRRRVVCSMKDLAIPGGRSIVGDDSQLTAAVAAAADQQQLVQVQQVCTKARPSLRFGRACSTVWQSHATTRYGSIAPVSPSMAEEEDMPRAQGLAAALKSERDPPDRACFRNVSLHAASCWTGRSPQLHPMHHSLPVPTYCSSSSKKQSRTVPERGMGIVVPHPARRLMQGSSSSQQSSHRGEHIVPSRHLTKPLSNLESSACATQLADLPDLRLPHDSDILMKTVERSSHTFRWLPCQQRSRRGINPNEIWATRECVKPRSACRVARQRTSPRVRSPLRPWRWSSACRRA